MKHLPVLLLVLSALAIVGSAAAIDWRLGLLVFGVISGAVGFLFVDLKP